jgi:hypothetical protein
LPIDEVMTSFYLRLRVADQTGVLAKITGILAEQGISIDAVIQREADEVSGEDGNQTDLMILTHDTKEGAMNKALAAMQALPTVLAPIVACARKSWHEIHQHPGRPDRAPFLRNPAGRPGARWRFVPAHVLPEGGRRHAEQVARPELRRAGVRDPVAATSTTSPPPT